MAGWTHFSRRSRPRRVEPGNLRKGEPCTIAVKPCSTPCCWPWRRCSSSVKLRPSPRLAARKAPHVLVALDLKIDDGKVEADVVRLANKHGVLGQVLFIGTTITSPAVRRRIKNADNKAPVAVLAQTAADLPKAFAAEHV